MQDAMWSFVELIYRNQGPEADQDWLTEELMEQAVADLGLDLERWRADYDGEAVVPRVEAADRQATEDGVSATPTFVVRGPGGERAFSGVPETSEIEAAVAEVGPTT
jgi:protein-disulfide isomerase